MTQLTKPPLRDRHPLPLRIITHNIRYAPPPSSLLPYEPSWPTRLPLLTSQFHFLTTTSSHSLICLQEVLTLQIHDLSASLGSEWAWYGVGRDDGDDEGERCVVMWRNEQWKKVWVGTRWLNEDGAKGKRGWDAGSVRVVSCVVLDALTGPGSRNRREESDSVEGEGGKRILILNTHLDNVGAESRRQSAHILLSLVSRLKHEFCPDFYVLTGDLNSEVDGDAYQILGQKGSGLRDALACVEEGPWTRYGEDYTYTGFDGKGDEDQALQRIDFVFVKTESEARKDSEGEVKGHAVMPNGWEDGKAGRMSDHRAVCVDLIV